MGPQSCEELRFGFLLCTAAPAKRRTIDQPHVHLPVCQLEWLAWHSGERVAEHITERCAFTCQSAGKVVLSARSAAGDFAVQSNGLAAIWHLQPILIRVRSMSPTR